MRRRTVIVALLIAVAIPRALGQQKPKGYRIAMAHPSHPISELSETGDRPPFAAFFQRLRELGYIEGQNLSVERYSARGKTENFTELVRAVIQDAPSAIFVSGSPLTLAFKAATTSIPIVANVGDPVAYGIVSNLARPGGNITGTTVLAGVEIWGKRLEFLREMVPAASKVAYLASRTEWESPYGAAVRDAAQRMKVELIGPPLDAPFEEAEYDRVFALVTEQHPNAMILGDGTQNITNRRLIIKLAQQARLPAMHPYPEFADIGALMAYGIDQRDAFRHAADQIDQILKGTKPGDIPFYQPTKFKLSINLKTAKALGITVPPTLLIAADEVIE